MRVTDEDGRILTDCAKCRHADACVAGFGDGCKYEKGLSRHYVFHLGKHRGKTVSQVTAEDPQYLLWMTSNVKWFELSEASKFELTSNNDGYDKLLYDAEVKREMKFATDKNENDADIHTEDGAGNADEF